MGRRSLGSFGRYSRSSRWSQTWSPVVMTWTPAANNSLAILGVIPLPPAEFSPFTMQKSTLCSVVMDEILFITAFLPGSPTISPRKRMRIWSECRI